MDSFTQKQLEKFEVKVERLEDKLDNVKSDVQELRADVKMYANEVKKHVGGDEKIITEILPTIHTLNEVLPELQQLLLKDKAKQIQEQEETKNRAKFKQTVGIAGTIIGAVVAIMGFVLKHSS